LARAYAAEGITLALTGQDQDRLSAVAEACRARGAAVTIGVIDVTDTAGMEGFLTRFDAGGPGELGIANAGSARGTQANGTLERHADAARQIAVNLIGTINSIAPLLPAMTERRAGHIAVVASVAGYRGLPDSPAYCASKAGVRIYGESLRAALADRDVAVSVIVPGFFESPMSRRFIGAQPLAMSLDDAVRRIHTGLRRRRRRIVFPRRLAIALQIADLLPAALGDAIIRRFRFHITSAPESLP
jgi:short-subunit dehydrogenase